MPINEGAEQGAFTGGFLSASRRFAKVTMTSASSVRLVMIGFKDFKGGGRFPGGKGYPVPLYPIAYAPLPFLRCFVY
jgi:hypothetical protein